MFTKNPAVVSLGEDGMIVCPNCGSTADMHPYSAEAFFRPEDGIVGNHVFVSHVHVKSTASGALPPGNPSARRDGVTIKFECLMCNTNSSLCIIQHKGATYFEWSM